MRNSILLVANRQSQGKAKAARPGAKGEGGGGQHQRPKRSGNKVFLNWGLEELFQIFDARERFT